MAVSVFDSSVLARADARVPEAEALAAAGRVARDTCDLNIAPYAAAGCRDLQVLTEQGLTGILDGGANAERLRRARRGMRRAAPLSVVTDTRRQRENCKVMLFRCPAAPGGRTPVVFSFRGTSGRLFDWVSNLRMRQEAGVHQGFLELTEQWIGHEKDIAFPSLGLRLPELLEACSDAASPFRIVLIGHSQGSAVAQLYMADLLRRGAAPENLLGLCFASPSVLGRTETPAAFPMLHILNSDDVVPHMGAFRHLGELFVYPADAEMRRACYAWDPAPEAVEARRLARAITGQMQNTERDLLIGMAYLRLLEEEPMGVLNEGLRAMGYPGLRLPGQVNDRLDGSARHLIDRAEQYAADAYESLLGHAIEAGDMEQIMRQIREITAGIGTVRFARAFGELCLEPHRMRPARGRTESGYGRIAMQGVPGLHRTDDRMFLRLSDGGKP